MMYGNDWFGNHNMSFWGGNAFDGWFYLILLGVVITIVTLILLSRRRKYSNGNQVINTLKELYVKGEITEEEYLKRKNVIKRH